MKKLFHIALLSFAFSMTIFADDTQSQQPTTTLTSPAPAQTPVTPVKNGEMDNEK